METESESGMNIVPWCGSMYEINCDSRNFNAFSKSEIWRDAVRQASTLYEVCEHVHVSNQVSVSTKLPEIKGPKNVSISHNGIIAIFFYATQTVFMKNVFNDQEVAFKSSSNTTVGFLDNFAVLIMEGYSLKKISIDKLFTRVAGLVCDNISSLICTNCNCDVTRIQSTRNLVYRATKDRVCLCFLDRRVSCVEEPPSPEFSIVSTAGVRVYDSIVFIRRRCASELEDAQPTSSGGKKEDSVGCKGDLIDTVIVSQRSPDNFFNALKKCGRDFVFRGENIRDCGGLLNIDEGNCLVRVNGDVFLFFDNKKGKWCFARIVVDKKPRTRLVDSHREFSCFLGE